MRRLILAAAAVLVMALPASGQEFTVAETVIPQQQRQGTFQSGSRTVDDTLARPMRLQADIASADYLDPANSLWIRFFRSEDNGATWKHIAGAKWVGGPYTDEDGNVNPMPWVQTDLTNFSGQLVRFEVDLPQRMRVGATVFY